MEKLISIGTALTLLGAIAISNPICAEPVNTQNTARQSSQSSKKPAKQPNKQPAKQPTSVQSATLPKLQEGSLVRGDTATHIYVINAGRRRLIPNATTFDVLGYKWERVVQIPEQQLKAIPQLPPIVLKNNTEFKDGTLIRGSVGGVYLISLGGRRLVPDAKTFEALGFKAEDVRQISDRELQGIPEYAPLTLSSLSFKDGTLVKGSFPAVYVISGNKRRLIPDEATFKALGYKWENIQTVSDRALSAIPELPPISARIAFQDGTLLKGSRAAVYVISSGRRRLIPNAQTFDALGYKWENVQQISDGQLESIPEMPPLPSY
jgi:hypothetical protein